MEDNERNLYMLSLAELKELQSQIEAELKRRDKAKRLARLREVEKELFQLTKDELKDKFLLNQRMGDHRNSLDKGSLVRMVARQIVNHEQEAKS